jgi:glycosyltransferase involved in cell wall biosynthesis
MHHTQTHTDSFRVAIITEDLRLPLDEGAKKATFCLLESFLKSDVRGVIFTSYHNPYLKQSHKLPANKLLLGWQFSHDLRREAPDVILYIPSSSFTLGAFVRASIIKVLSTGKPLALLSTQYRKLPTSARYFGLYQSIDLVLTQSPASEEASRSLGWKTLLLHSGVDNTIFLPVSEQYRCQLRSESGYLPDDRIILHVGHGNRRRNVHYLSRFTDAGYKVILITSTSTTTDTRLLSQLRASGVFVIDTYQEHIQHYYQIADCYLFPVLDATAAIDIPLSVLEAMACNLPVVTTRYGGLPAMFQHGNGFYYADTEEDMLRMVKYAIEMKNCKTIEMIAQYTWDNFASSILNALWTIRHQ